MECQDFRGHIFGEVIFSVQLGFVGSIVGVK